MTKSYTSHSWTPEKLKLASRKDLETVRKNAVRLGVGDLIDLCDNELRARGPLKAKRAHQSQPKHSETDVVTGYHFVCARDRGVTQLGEDRFWSGSWVVAETNVRSSMKYGAYLALHESKSDLSYRQGQILDYRRTPKDMVSKTTKEGIEVSKIEEGVEFLVQGTTEPYEWVGEGAGEKGYRWTKITPVPSSEPSQDTVPSK